MTNNATCMHACNRPAMCVTATVLFESTLAIFDYVHSRTDMMVGMEFSLIQTSVFLGNS